MTLLVSCKGSKQAVSDKEQAPRTGKLEPLEELKFSSYFIDGCAARMKGNLDEARKLFLECDRMNPASAPVKYELAIIFKLLGANEQALMYAKVCAQAEPDNEWYQLVLIECYNLLRQYDKSIRLREELVKRFPSKSDFKEDLAIEYAVVGQYDKAYKIYSDLEKIYGTSEQLSVQKSNLLKKQGKYKEAEIELMRLLESNKQEPRYYSYLADFYIEQNDLPKAKVMYDKIIEIDPGNPTVNLALHDYYSTQGKLDMAMECLRKAFLNPDLDAPTKAGIATSFFRRMKDSPYFRDHAKELAGIFVQVHPQSAEANSLYADHLSLEGDHKGAAVYYSKACLKEKGNYGVWDKLMLTYNKLQWQDSLEKASAAAMELFPNSPKAYLMNGSANLRLKNYKKAVRSFKDGLEFVIDDNLLMLEFYSGLGDAAHYAGEFEMSDKAFEDALKVNADNTRILNQYAYFLSIRKTNIEKAEKLSRKANELYPDNPAYMDTYGWILYQQKKYADAEMWLGKAFKYNTRSPNIAEHYGDVLYRIGKVDEAVQHWERAKANGGDQERLNKKIRDKKLED